MALLRAPCPVRTGASRIPLEESCAFLCLYVCTSKDHLEPCVQVYGYQSIKQDSGSESLLRR